MDAAEAAQTAPNALPPLDEGGDAEDFLVRAWRKMAAGRADCPVLAQDFAGVCGNRAPDLRTAMTGFLGALASTARRKLLIGYPGCLVRTQGERQLLALLAAAQADNDEAVEAHLRWLVKPERRAAVTLALMVFARMLLINGVRLEPVSSSGIREAAGWPPPVLPRG